MSQSIRRPSAQSGVAVVTALLLTALAVTLVAGVFWQQQVQLRVLENQRLHGELERSLLGQLDWAAAILNADAKRVNNVDYLGQSWSQPLLNSHIEAESDAVVSRRIIDAQSRYNLTNLSGDGGVNKAELATFQRLLRNLQLSPALAVSIAEYLRKPSEALPPDVRSGGVLPLLHVDDLLAIPGVTPAAVERMRDFVVVLPVPTPVNLNTASLEVLSACFESMTQADASFLIASRAAAYFRDAADFSARLGGNKNVSAGSNAKPVGFSSNYFLVDSQVRIGRAVGSTLSLLKRESNLSTVLWTRQQ
ncbi:MAG TPA: type II secretion system minor pseudopilin GspK [Rhodocyclaceae bacterium]|nr:type II secretion system minor pseudopilin GspK [Rhodocyclaceae bacterium]